ncbi:MAG TPA: hypothetical protein VFA08_09200 [Actinomycetota bacterium]|jgi:hypothetical protein|nr:hypothetical protein [Actinomycetota bacterium]
MFGLKKKGPDTVFIHTDDCKIWKADPNVEIPWSYVGDGLWKAECVCTHEFWREPITDKRPRQDPLDPKTSRHMPECEFAGETEPSVLRLVLRVQEGAGGTYWLVQCAVCDAGWQVAHYARETG